MMRIIGSGSYGKLLFAQAEMAGDRTAPTWRGYKNGGNRWQPVQSSATHLNPLLESGAWGGEPHIGNLDQGPDDEGWHQFPSKHQ